MKTVYVVGKLVDAPHGWEMQGVFDDVALAIAVVKGDMYFIGPLTLNEELPDKTTDWPGIYYPKRKERS